MNKDRRIFQPNETQVLTKSSRSRYAGSTMSAGPSAPEGSPTVANPRPENLPSPRPNVDRAAKGLRGPWNKFWNERAIKRVQREGLETDRRPDEVKGEELLRSGRLRSDDEQKLVDEFVKKHVEDRSDNAPEKAWDKDLSSEQKAVGDRILGNVIEQTALQCVDARGKAIKSGEIYATKMSDGTIAFVSYTSNVPEEGKVQKESPEVSVFVWDIKNNSLRAIDSDTNDTLPLSSSTAQHEKSKRELDVRNLVEKGMDKRFIVDVTSITFDTPELRDDNTGEVVVSAMNPLEQFGLSMSAPVMAVDIRKSGGEASSPDSVKLQVLSEVVGKAAEKKPLPSSVWVGKNRGSYDAIGEYLKGILPLGAELPELSPLAKAEGQKIPPEKRAYDTIMGERARGLNLSDKGNREFALGCIIVSAGKEGIMGQENSGAENPFVKLGVKPEVADAFAFILKNVSDPATVVEVLDSLRDGPVTPLKNRKNYFTVLASYLTPDKYGEYVDQLLRTQQNEFDATRAVAQTTR